MDAANLRDGNGDGIRGDGTMEQEAGSRPLGRTAVVQESDGRALPAPSTIETDVVAARAALLTSTMGRVRTSAGRICNQISGGHQSAGKGGSTAAGGQARGTAGREASQDGAPRSHVLGLQRLRRTPWGQETWSGLGPWAPGNHSPGVLAGCHGRRHGGQTGRASCLAHGTRLDR